MMRVETENLRTGTPSAINPSMDPEAIRPGLVSLWNRMQQCREPLREPGPAAAAGFERPQRAAAPQWKVHTRDAMPPLMAYIDRDERYCFVSAQYERLFGLAPGSCVGRKVREMLDEDTYRNLEAPIASVLAGNQLRFESQTWIAGRKRVLQMDCIPDRDHGAEVSGFLVSLTDVTVHHRHAERQAAEEARLVAITPDLPVLIMRLDAWAKIRYCNQICLAWFGTPAHAMIGLSLDHAIGTSRLQPQADVLAQALSGQLQESEFEVSSRGVRRWLQATYIPDLDADGAVCGLYAVATDITRLKTLQGQLVKLARFDTLTGLANRGEFNGRLQDAIHRSNRSGLPIALLFIDVDDFKQINDQHGHDAGDEVLQELAIRLQGSVRKSDLVARLSGDEFVIILEDLKDCYEPEFVAHKVLTAARRTIVHHDTELTIGVSIGIGFHTDVGASARDLLVAADQALYGAKNAGRNTYRVNSESFRRPTLPPDASSSRGTAVDRGGASLRSDPA